MNYEVLTTEDRVQGVLRRIAELEGQYFSNTVYSLEAETVGDYSAVDELAETNRGIFARIEVLNALVARLKNASDIV